MAEWPQDVREKALVSCGRRCSLCGKFAGGNMELHHIVARADGGESIFDNCIPLCLDCHANVGHYNPRHPKGTKHTANELKEHRNRLYRLVASGTILLASADVDSPPPFSYGPIPELEVFGRVALVGEISDRWNTYRIQALTGGPGIGKSGAAGLYVRMTRPSWKGIVWLAADEAASFDAQLANLAVTRGWAVQDQAQFDQIARARSALEQMREDVLVVLDNIEAVARAQAFMTELPQARFLVTARDSFMPQGWNVIEVDQLDAPSAGALVSRRFNVAADHGSIEPFLKLVGRHPLIIAQSAAYSRVMGYSLEEFVVCWPRERRAILESFPTCYSDEGRNLLALVAAVWKRIKETSPAAAVILAALSWLRSEGTDRDIFEFSPFAWPKALGDVLPNDPLRLAAYKSVVQSGLVTWVDSEILQPEGPERRKAFAMHRAYQHALRLTMPPFKHATSAALEFIFREDCRSEPANWTCLRRCLPAALAYAADPDLDCPKAPQAIFNIAAWSSSDRSLVEARELAEKVLDIRSDLLGPDHPETLMAANLFASILQEMGELDKAESLHRKTWKKRQAVLGDDHEETLTSLNNLAITIQDLGRLVEASVMHADTLEARRRILGPNHPDTWDSLNNLSIVLQELGDFEGARAMQEECLESSRRSLGSRHPDTLKTLNNYANLLSRVGDLVGARTMHEDCLAAKRSVLGPTHRSTLSSMSNLAFVLDAMGLLQQARRMHEECLRGRRDTLPENHPDIADSIGQLAGTLTKLGAYDEAEQLARECLDRIARIPGIHDQDIQSLTALLSQIAQDRADNSRARRPNKSASTSRTSRPAKP